VTCRARAAEAPPGRPEPRATPKAAKTTTRARAAGLKSKNPDRHLLNKIIQEPIILDGLIVEGVFNSPAPGFKTV
jgi:hypothetical protein